MAIDAAACVRPSSLADYEQSYPALEPLLPSSHSLEITRQLVSDAAIHVSPTIAMLLVGGGIAALVVLSSGNKWLHRIGVSVLLSVVAIALAFGCWGWGLPALSLKLLAANHSVFAGRMTYTSTQVLFWVVERLPNRWAEEIESLHASTQVFGREVLTESVRQTLIEARVDDASALLTLSESDPALDRMAGIALIRLGDIAFRRGDKSAAFAYSESAYRRWPGDVTANIYYAMRVSRGLHLLDEEPSMLPSALAMLEEIPAGWTGGEAGHEALIERLMMAHISTVMDRRRAETMPGLYRRYLLLSQRRSDAPHCLFAFAELQMASAQLDGGEFDAAVDTLEAASEAVRDGKTTRALLLHAYQQSALGWTKRGDYERAVNVLERALDRRYSEVSCQLGDVLERSALQSADIDLFDKARAKARRALQLCASPTIDQLMAWISLAELRSLATSGRLHDANIDRLASEASRHEAFRLPTLALLQAIHLGRHYVPQIQSAKRFQSSTPTVQGVDCVDIAEEREAAPCRTLMLTDGRKRVGISHEPFHEVSLETEYSGVYVTLADHRGNGRIDEWSLIQGSRGDSYFDDDADGLPDRRVQVGESTQLETALSGRISYRVASAVVAQWDEPLNLLPDVYVCGRHSRESHSHCSDVIRNSNYPVFDMPWYSIDFKYGDSLRLDLWDYDSFSDDDWIGGMTIGTLPNSGFLLTENRAAAIDLRVLPTAALIGHRATQPEEQAVNVFRAPIDQFDAEFTAVLEEAATAERASDRTKLFVEIVVPELVLWTPPFRSVGLLGQIGTVLLGGEALHVMLSE